MKLGGEIQSKVIMGVVGLAAAYVVYRFLKGEVSGAVSGGIDKISDSIGTVTAPAGTWFNENVSPAIAVTDKIVNVEPDASKLSKANSYAIAAIFPWIPLASHIKSGVGSIYDWITGSDDNPTTTVITQPNKLQTNANGVPIYIAKPEGTPNTVFTMESLSKGIPFLH